jgi:precorrin-8X/cobalt-precorrin-8 methylmutase
MRPYEKNPSAIYKESFKIAASEANMERFPVGLREIVLRLIHACGMPEIADRISFSDEAFKAGFDALQKGAPILCDCEMVKAGITSRYLPIQTKVITTLNDPRTESIAKSISNTRSAAAVELWKNNIEGAIVCIGNAPTALFHLLELLEKGWPRPALILGFPVGFVGAAESKAELAKSNLGLSFITLKGRRGGSALASAAVNALSVSLKKNE